MSEASENARGRELGGNPGGVSKDQLRMIVQLPTRPGNPVGGAVTLRDYQTAALDAVDAALARGIRRQLISLPTGAGKTVIFADLIRRRSGRALVLAHRDELISQARDKIETALPGAEVGMVKASRDEVDAQVVVASVATVSRDGRLARLADSGRFATIVVDEAHHAAADSYRRVIGALDTELLVGVTATPDRSDGLGLDGVFQEIVYEKSMTDLIEAGYLCDLRATQVAIDADFGALGVRAGDIIESQAAAMLVAANAPDVVAEAVAEHAADRCILVFTPSVALAEATAVAMTGRGIPTSALSGETPEEERRQILRDLRSGALQAVVNCAVLTEGFDEPRVDCVVIARPTKSRALYTQMVGRGTRTYPGKRDALILDLVGATMRHDLVSLADLVGVDADEVRRSGVRQAVAEAKAAAEAVAAEGRLVAATVQLFTERPANWIPIAGRRHALPLGDAGTVVLTPRFGDRWDVVLIPSDQSARVRVIADAQDLSWATGIAESLAREAGAVALVARGAGWRGDPATDKQRKMLRQLGGGARDISTKGQAADAITAAIAVKRLESEA
jgi:ATP-dependent helicase IRC3